MRLDRDQVMALLEKARSNDERPNLTKAIIGSQDLSGFDFSGTDLSGAMLEGASLEGAIFQNADLSRCNLAQAKLVRADFRGACLKDADLRYADLSEIITDIKTDLRGARTLGTIMTKVDNNLVLPRTRKEIREREAHQRALVSLDAKQQAGSPLELPVFPHRWESLKAEADRNGIPLKPLIHPVKEAIAQVERELQWIRQTGKGKLLVLSGATGSGKTTFLNSLNLFLDSVDIYEIHLSTIASRDYVDTKLTTLARSTSHSSIIILEGKETEGSLTGQEIEILLPALNADFRTRDGQQSLFVIPTTSQTLAQLIAQKAESVGIAVSTGSPFYIFKGPARSDFVSITNDMVRALNADRSLADFGVTEEQSRAIAEAADTIGRFMEGCLNEILRQQEQVREVSKSIKRKRIHLWMVFASLENESRFNYDLIRSLTLDDTLNVQVNRILVGDSKEVQYWESRRHHFAQAARYLDLRIMYLPMRTANAVLTAYGSNDFVKSLKAKGLIKREATRERAQDSIASTAIGFFLQRKGYVDDPSKRGRQDESDRSTFGEIVSLARGDDKMVQSAIAEVLRNWNTDPEVRVATELPLDERGALRADVVWVTPTDIYCLEFKWRSSPLNTSDIIRETAGRVKDYAVGLSELRNLIDAMK